jgi:hypothetical protein
LQTKLPDDYPGCYDAMVDGFATLEQIKKDERLRHCKGNFLFRQKIRKKNRLKRSSLGANLYVVKPFRSKISRTSTGFNPKKHIQHYEIRRNLYPKHRPTRAFWAQQADAIEWYNKPATIRKMKMDIHNGTKMEN